MRRFIESHLSFPNVVSLVALFIALGGVSYAATVPNNSVGSAQIKNNAVTASEIKNGAVVNNELASDAVTGGKVKAASLSADDLTSNARAELKGSAGPPGAQGVPGPPGPAGATGPPRPPQVSISRTSPPRPIVQPPAPPTQTLFSEAITLPVAGNYDVGGFSQVNTSSCPTGGAACTFRAGLFLDGEPLASTGADFTVDPSIQPSPPPTWFAGAFGNGVPLPSGTHVLSMRVAQTAGPAANLTEAEHGIDVRGPFVSG